MTYEGFANWFLILAGAFFVLCVLGLVFLVKISNQLQEILQRFWQRGGTGDMPIERDETKADWWQQPGGRPPWEQ